MPPNRTPVAPLHHESALANDLMINLSTQPVQFSRGLAFTILNVAKSCNCCTAPWNPKTLKLFPGLVKKT